MDTLYSAIIPATVGIEPPVLPTTAVPVPEPAELISKGLGFLSGLAQTFASPDATQKMVSTLVDKDPVSGKTYLKIPVDNEQVVTDALNLFG